MPSVPECDEMIRRQTRVLEAMNRIRDVVVAHQTAKDEQRTREEATKANLQLQMAQGGEFGGPGSTGEDGGAVYANGVDKGEGGGGFAGAEAKKRRGVSSFSEIPSLICLKKWRSAF